MANIIIRKIIVVHLINTFLLITDHISLIHLHSSKNMATRWIYVSKEIGIKIFVVNMNFLPMLYGKMFFNLIRMIFNFK